MAKSGKRRLPKKVIKEELKKFSIRANRKEIKIMGLVSEEIEANSNTLKINPMIH